MTHIQSILITGANAGLGYETAKQLAQKNNIEKIYLACRNLNKAQAAQENLQKETGRNIFEIILMDVGNLKSVTNAVEQIDAPIDALILNAGGMGGKDPLGQTKDQISNIFSSNLYGHAHFVKLMLNKQLITSTIILAGSEVARGIKKMGIEQPQIDGANVQDFKHIATGERFNAKTDSMEVYAYVKLFGAFWMASLARKHPHIRFITMSPGGTTGTNGMDDLPFRKKLMFKHIGSKLMPLMGMMHSVDKGAKRYISALEEPHYKSGHFYASEKSEPTGKVVDQIMWLKALDDEQLQDNAFEAIEQLS